MSVLAPFDRALPPHVTLSIVNARHLAGRLSTSGAQPTPEPARQRTQRCPVPAASFIR